MSKSAIILDMVNQGSFGYCMLNIIFKFRNMYDQIIIKISKKYC